MENEIMENELTVSETKPKNKSFKSRFKKVCASIGGTVMAVMATATTALATGGGGTGGGGGGFGQNVTINTSADPQAADVMGNVIGILLTITRFVGIALVIYGVYEIVMSFMQNQPEAKTKGIIMALAGVVMIALKSIIGSMGLGIS